MCSSTPKCDNSQLASLMESDDSETEDNLEEFLLDERNSKELAIKNKNNLLPKYVFVLIIGFSSHSSCQKVYFSIFDVLVFQSH